MTDTAATDPTPAPAAAAPEPPGSGRAGRTSRRPRSRSSLALRIALVTSLLVLLAVGASVAVTAWLGSRIAARAAAEQLDLSHEVQRAFRDQRYQRLWLTADLFALDPYLAAYVAEAAETADTASILDLLGQNQQQLGFDFAAVLTPAGRVLAHTDRPDAPGEDLSRRALVAQALAEYEASGVWAEDDRLYDAVLVPVARGLDLGGFLLVGFRIDDELARGVREASRAEVAYFLGAGGDYRPVGATLPEAEARELTQALRDRAAEVAELTAGGPVGDPTGGRLTLDLRGRPWLALITPVRDAAGDPVGVSATLASLDEQLATYRRLQWLLTGTGAAAVLLAVALAYPLARRSLRPVRQLAEAAEAARRGDFDRRIEGVGDDEVGRLAATFDELLASLREKRDMEAYMSRLSLSLPEAPERRAAPGAGAADAEVAPAGDLSRLADLQGTARTLRLPDEAEAAGRPEAPAPAAPGHLGVGSVLGGRFEVVSVLGAGGMGVVYEARDRELDELVALKVLRLDLADRDEQRDRLKDELRLARRITHPNVLRTYDFGHTEGVTFVSMEYVRGVTLRALLEGAAEPLPFRAALRLARQVAAGLAAAHELGVVHRDVKPENVILDAAGNAKVMDFGIARTVREESAYTRAGQVVGTPHYISPERLRSEPADARSDVYSLGILLFEVFTGEQPFAGGTLPQIVSQHLYDAPPPARSRRAELPPELETILLRCLAKQPEERYADAGALLAALDRVRG